MYSGPACRSGIIPTGSCAAARRLFRQYPKTLSAPKRGRGGKDPAASRIVFSFPDFRLCCRAPSRSRTAARRLILPSLLSARLRQRAATPARRRFPLPQKRRSGLRGHTPALVRSRRRSDVRNETNHSHFGRKVLYFFVKKRIPGLFRGAVLPFEVFLVLLYVAR